MRVCHQQPIPVALTIGAVLTALAFSGTWSYAADTTSGMSLQIHAVGVSNVRLADPIGRVYPRTDSSQIALPECQSWENVLLRPSSARASMIPRAQLAIAHPLEGTYRIELVGRGQPVYLEFVAWGGDSTTGMQDHLFASVDTIYRWDASWRRPQAGGKFVVELKRSARRAKTSRVR